MLGIIVLFLIPVDKKFSYHFVKGECNNKASWIYNRIFEKEDAIDIVFSGASQTSCTFMDEYIEEILGKNGKKIKVANLGYCRRGRDIQYVMMKDLFKNKNPKLLIIEVPEDEPKKSHPVFPYLAETDDLFDSFVFFNQLFFENFWKGLIIRFEYLKFKTFHNDNFIINNESDFGYLHSNQIVSPEIIRQNEIVWKNRLSKSRPNLLRKIELNYSKHYIKKIVELAHQNKCEVLFLYLPESGSKLPSPLESEFYKDLGELILLPDSIITNKSNWMDATHFNDSGAIQVSDFLINQLSEVR